MLTAIFQCMDKQKIFLDCLQQIYKDTIDLLLFNFTSQELYHLREASKTFVLNPLSSGFQLRSHFLDNYLDYPQELLDKLEALSGAEYAILELYLLV